MKAELKNVAAQDESPTKESKEERVARITAKHTLLATLITAIAGLGGAAIQHVASGSGGSQPSPGAPAGASDRVRQNWFTIEGVEILNAAGLTGPARVRVVVQVGNLKFSYPSPVIWEPVQGDMPDESFPLPIDSASFDVSFTMFLDNAAGGPTSFHSQEPISVTSIPFEGEAKLVGFTPSTRSTDPSELQGRVKFSFAAR